LGEVATRRRNEDGEIVADPVPPPEGMAAYPVSTFVNAPRNEGPQCVEKVA
jgi:hypothetical protein